MTGAAAGPDVAHAPLAVTMGEPAGIGPDITLVAWTRRHRLKLPPFCVFGDPDFLAARARLLNLDVPISVVSPAQAAQTFAGALPVVRLPMTATAKPSQPDSTSAPVAIASIRHAAADVMAGRCRAVVTNPIAKSVLYGGGFTDPGHTEFLARLAGEKAGRPVQPVMMLWSRQLAVVPVTIHIPLKDVPARLTSGLIVSTGRIVAGDMTAKFGVARPRLAVAGLNPHAGENGGLGEEDRSVVEPAVRELVRLGIEARGPLPADTLFHEAARRTYDVALCMYHDQALIPIKTIAFDDAVNVTLGLPFTRTSPDHGTAFDIAGTGRARPESLIAAIDLAARLTAGPQPAAIR